MCGIAGLLQVGTTSELVDVGVARAAVGRMVDELRHRGPDGIGLQVIDPAGGGSTAILGHTRLAILDLSSAGSQPMFSSDGQLSVTYNGEIYNFKQLREELGHDGERWQ